MTRASNFIRSSTLALVLAALAVGCSTGDSEQSDTPATTRTADAAPAPTPDSVQLAVFERAYSECASTDFERLSAKYKVAVKTRSNVATAVALGWIDFLRAGQDALPDGRSGCLQGLDDR